MLVKRSFYRWKSESIYLFILCSLSLKAQQKLAAGGLEVISDAQNVVNTASSWVARIDAAVNEVQNTNAYKTIVDGKSITFPYGVLPDNGNSDYALVVNGVNLDNVGRMTAEVFMKIPYSAEDHLYFLADKVPLNASGQLSDTLKLFLMKSATFDVGQGYDLLFKGLDDEDGNFSFISFTCKGFEKVHLGGQEKTLFTLRNLT